MVEGARVDGAITETILCKTLELVDFRAGMDGENLDERLPFL